MDKRTEKRKALEALNKVLKTESDIDDAFLCDLGPVCLKYGNSGTSENNLKKDSALST